MACQRDAGYDAVALPDGGLQIPGEAVDNGTDAACLEMLGPGPTPAPITAAEASALYDADLASKACLEAHGVTVPDPSSRAAYIENYLSGRAPWDPYANVGDRMDDVCPSATLESIEQ